MKFNHITISMISVIAILLVIYIYRARSLNYILVWAITPQYDELEEYRGGVLPVRIGKNWGAINAKGNTVIPIKFREIWIKGDPPVVWVSDFQGKWGAFSTDGKVILKTQYKDVNLYYSLNSGYACIRTNDGNVLIDSKGNKVNTSVRGHVRLF